MHFPFVVLTTGDIKMGARSGPETELITHGLSNVQEQI
jgi:hypothetical protein